MIIVIAVPGEGDGGKPRRALAGLQHFHKLGFPTVSGKFGITPVLYAYPSDTLGALERIGKVVELHQPKTVTGQGLDGGSFTFCTYCSGHPEFPCETLELLLGKKAAREHALALRSR